MQIEKHRYFITMKQQERLHNVQTETDNKLTLLTMKIHL